VGYFVADNTGLSLFV